MVPNRSKLAFSSVESRIYYQTLRLIGQFLLDHYPLGLYLTEIASGTISRVCETSRPTVQSRCSVLQRNKVYYQRMRPTGKFLLDFYLLGLYSIGITSGMTT